MIALAFLAGCTGGGSPVGSDRVAAALPPSYWRPGLTDTWQWQLSGELNTSHAATVYDIDLFDTPVSAIRALQAAGRKVVCYFSAGSSENWRPDFSRFKPGDMGSSLDGWAGERWLDTRSLNVRQIMHARLALAARKGCNGVEPDNVDGYANKSGLPLTADAQLDYNRFLAAEAHSLGLSIGLKNDVDQLADLVEHFDFAVNEQCHEYKECDGYQAFISHGKPVFNAEYAASYRTNPKARAALCADARARGFQTLLLPQELDDSFRYSCGPG